MKRFLSWLASRITGHASRVRTIDLPEQFGARMRLEVVRGVFSHPGHRETLNAVAQLLWMHRQRASGDAMDAALVGQPGRDLHLGQMSAVDNVLGDLVKLMDAKEGDEVPREMRGWFRE